MSLGHSHRDNDAAALSLEGLDAALADISVSADDGHLAAHHNVGGPVDTVNKRMATAKHIVKLALGHRVVDVDGRKHERSRLHHLVQTLHTLDRREKRMGEHKACQE